MLRNETDRKAMWQTRVQNLAKVHGPSVRFYPGDDDNDDDDNKVVVLDKAIEGSEKAGKSPEEQAAEDTARKAEQQIEQERGNTTRANAATKTAQDAADAAQTQVEELQTKLEAAETKAIEAGIKDVEDLNIDDYTDTDRAIVRSINALKEQVKAEKVARTALEKKAEGFEQQEQDKSAKAESASQYEELLSDLDKEYGPDCRNAALENWNKLVADGKVTKNRPGKATRMLEQCYKEAKSAQKDKKGKKSESNLDMGDGGGSTVNLGTSEIESGISLADYEKRLAGSAKT